MHIIKSIRFFVQCVLLAVVLCLLVLFVRAKYVIETKEPDDIQIKTLSKQINDTESMAYTYDENASEDTIVFVGGLSGWSGTWERTIEALGENLKPTKKRYNFFAVDLPPFGVSVADLEKGFHRTVQAKRLSDLLEGWNTNIIFVAHSYGAGPVMEAVMNKPQRVKKVIIIDGVLNIDEQRTVKSNFLFEHPKFLETLIAMFSHNKGLIQKQLSTFVHQKNHIDEDLTRVYMQPFSQKGHSEKLAAWLIDYMSDGLSDAKSAKSENYKDLKMPVRIIWGEKDTLTPIDLADKIIAPDRKLYPLQDVGHIPMIEDYEQFDRAIIEAIIE